MYRYFKTVNSVDSISEWKSKGLFNESIKTPSTSNNSLSPLLDYVNAKATHDPRAIVNIYIVYEISKNYNISSYPTLENCLFGAVSLTKHADIDHYKYSGYGIGFDRKGEFSFRTKGFGRNVIIFGAILENSKHYNNKANNVLVFGKDFVKGINGTTIYAEKMYSISITENNKKFCLSLHYNGADSYLFKMVQKFKNLKQKILRLCHIHYV